MQSEFIKFFVFSFSLFAFEITTRVSTYDDTNTHIQTDTWFVFEFFRFVFITIAYFAIESTSCNHIGWSLLSWYSLCYILLFVWFRSVIFLIYIRTPICHHLPYVILICVRLQCIVYVAVGIHCFCSSPLMMLQWWWCISWTCVLVYTMWFSVHTPHCVSLAKRKNVSSNEIKKKNIRQHTDLVNQETKI